MTGSRGIRRKRDKEEGRTFGAPGGLPEPRGDLRCHWIRDPSGPGPAAHDDRRRLATGASLLDRLEWRVAIQSRGSTVGF